MTRFLVQHRNETRLSLIVDVVDHMDSAAIDRLRREMHGKGCASGLLVDTNEVIVLRDTFSSMDDSAIREERRLATAQLISGSGTLSQRVENWLRGLADDWNSVLPSEEWAMVLLYDIVPALSGSEIWQVEPTAA